MSPAIASLRCTCSLMSISAAVQAAARGTLALRYLDISGSVALSDAAIAMLLGLCPRLRVLHALDSNLGPASLAALAGRAVQPTEQQEHSRQHRQAGPYGTTAAANGMASEATTQLEVGLGSLHLDVSGRTAQPGAATRHPPAAQVADSGAAAALTWPACRLLERLAIGGSSCRLKGSALRRALRCLPNLTDLGLHSCEVHAVLDPLLPLAGSKGGNKSSSKAEAIGHVLSQLSRLEVMGCDDFSPPHVAVLLQHCTSLRRLALSSKQLAADRFDRQQHGSLSGRSSSSDGGCGSSSGSDGGCGSSSGLPSLQHLAVGYGAGGTFLVHAAEQAPHLTSLTIHLGAAASDSQLAAVAASCRHLERLCLQGANVSDEGAVQSGCGTVCLCDVVCTCTCSSGMCHADANSPACTVAACAGVISVLERCPRLTSLQLCSCVGPLTDRLGTACIARRGTALRLRELHIGWGASQLTDDGLAALLHPDVAELQSLVRLVACTGHGVCLWSQNPLPRHSRRAFSQILTFSCSPVCCRC